MAKKSQKILIMLRRFVHYLNSQKNFILLIGCASLFSSNIYSQENNYSLYLIAGTIYVNIPPGTYYSYLFRYDNHALDTVTVLSTDSTQLNFIKAYHNQRKVVLLKNGYIYSDTAWFQVISMDNPRDISTLNLGNQWQISSKNLVSLKDSFYYIFDKGGEYFGVNIDGLSTKTFNSPVILKDAIIKGDVGGLMETHASDYILLDHNANGDSVYISIGNNEKVYFNFKIPEPLISVDKEYYAIQSSNNNYLVIWNESSEYNQLKIIGKSNLIILNKETKRWNKLQVKGNNVYMINFGDWLAGWVTESYDDENGFTWTSPGKKDRKQEDNALGSTFDERAEQQSVYMPGILYMYNMNTQQYFEWNTGQGDSEILLVHNNYVYYRTADEIWKASIIGGKALGKPELLIKHEVIHDVHWAFISEN